MQATKTHATPDADHLRLNLASPEETNHLGAVLARHLGPGDLVFLSGPLGAGKSHLARAIVKSLLDDPAIDVPSPSYTLANVYEAPDFEIWHADLYRLGGEDDLSELGLDDALDHALVLVEWPDRWADPPPRRLEMTLAATGPCSRALRLRSLGPAWTPLITALEELR